jgi:CRP-like cAMP-binding protein
MDLIQDLETPYLKKLTSIATEAEFEEDEIVYREGEVGKAIYLIESGEVAIEMEVPDYGSVTVYKVGPGQLFGWSSLFPPRRKKARARVLKPTQAIVIDADKLRNLFRLDQGLEYAMMGCITQIVVDRMHATRLKLLEVLASAGKA